MATGNPLIDRLVTRLALAVAVLVGASLPVGYALIAYGNLLDQLSFKAQVKAHELQGLIVDQPEHWVFAENRIQGVVKRGIVASRTEQIEVFDERGRLLSVSGPTPPGPHLQRREALRDADRIAGWVAVNGSLLELLRGSTIAAGLGLLLGALVWLALRTVPLRALRGAEQRVEDEQARALVTLQSLGEGIITVDARQDIVYANPVAQRMLDLPLDALIGQPLADAVRIEDGTTGQPQACALATAMQTLRETACAGHSTLRAANGGKIPVEERATPLLDRQGRLVGGVLCLHDVSTVREYLKQRTWEAAHDTLTGLINRREFEKRLARAVDTARNTGQSHVLCYLDLDRFKVVNDSCGHTAGDQLLTELARLLQARIRETDTLARIGGDEFALLLENCERERGEAIAGELLALVADYRFEREGRIFTVGLSVGLTTITAASLGPAEVQGQADSACYWAKEQGRHRVCVFVAGDEQLAARRSETGWVSRITAALNEERFVLYHQTFRSLAGAPGLHLEVLLRMVDESGQIVPPGHFLPAAERYNLIPGIDRWVLRKVFSSFDRIAARFDAAPLTVNLNLSGASVGADWLLPLVRELLAEYRVDPHCLCFEITETVAIRHLQAAAALIEECKALGIRFALDDFGTGTSSFSYLRKLPVDYLKIDGSFVRDIRHDPIDRAMTETINHIGHLLGKQTVAEYVEDEETAEMLERMGVDFAQGYAVCRPQPLLLP